MPETPTKKTDTRINLDEDNRDRYTKWAADLGVSREWLVNHHLRTIANGVITTELESTPEATVQVGRRRLIIKKSSRNSHEFL